MFSSMGSALMAAKNLSAAAGAFELAARYDQQSSPKETSLGEAYLGMGKIDLAKQHLEKAISLDSLNLDAATALIRIYSDTGEEPKAAHLAERFAGILKMQPQPASSVSK